ncbi:hypothetical protein Y032_0708g1714 [Ancylostoma ceylanicum]|uniref:GIY-YIG domain-containing protein n=1 Tax=Ancylostoma ceylanicum TaxID=53326 RepID=A0A016WG68_9BILA|nr:hypothetical protein Y032_0708g1714 [Ancylostoma ceylanicum]
MLRGKVYLIRCEGCGEKYVGETMRPIRRRMDEHRRALTNPASYPSESILFPEYLVLLLSDEGVNAESSHIKIFTRLHDINRRETQHLL